MPSARQLPSIDRLLDRPALAPAITAHGRAAVVSAARQATADLRRTLLDAAEGPHDGEAASDHDLIARLEEATLALVSDQIAPSLRPVINATGVILHTNLGRAPLARPALQRLADLASGYSNLEYDVASGERGHRHVHAERLLCDLTGAEAGAIVNNNAAATLLVLAATSAGREVIVSRGELVEIGGGFRVPEVMAQSGAVLREVGTTNRTRLSDYAAAISDRTALILRVHPSNFSMSGFTERPQLVDLAALAHRFTLPLFEDLGSGWIGLDDETAEGLEREPSVRASLAAGVDLVAFSGDKLLGGPQAGIIVGRREHVDPVRRHPLMRALRAGKLTYAALEATLALWARAPQRSDLPVLRMLRLTVAEIDARARRFAEQLAGTVDLEAMIIDGFSTTGGGSAPDSQLLTRLVALRCKTLPASALESRLRALDPPIVARIQQDVVVLDLRTVPEEQDDAVARSIRQGLAS